jgi:hypothetical protein
MGVVLVKIFVFNGLLREALFLPSYIFCFYIPSVA